MVEFKDHHKERKRGFIQERNATQFVIEHPNGETWSIWVEQISHKVWDLKWPGLCTMVREREVDSKITDHWCRVLENIRHFASSAEKKMIDKILAPIKYVAPLIVEDKVRENYVPSSVVIEPMEEVEV
jgi:hypothetical protein